MIKIAGFALNLLFYENFFVILCFEERYENLKLIIISGNIKCRVNTPVKVRSKTDGGRLVVVLIISVFRTGKNPSKGQKQDNALSIIFLKTKFWPF